MTIRQFIHYERRDDYGSWFKQIKKTFIQCLATSSRHIFQCVRNGVTSFLPWKLLLLVRLGLIASEFREWKGTPWLRLGCNYSQRTQDHNAIPDQRNQTVIGVLKADILDLSPMNLDQRSTAWFSDSKVEWSSFAFLIVGHSPIRQTFKRRGKLPGQVHLAAE